MAKTKTEDQTRIRKNPVYIELGDQKAMLLAIVEVKNESAIAKYDMSSVVRELVLEKFKRLNLITKEDKTRKINRQVS